MTPSQNAWLALCAYTCQLVLLHLSSGVSFQRVQVSSLLIPVLARVLLPRQQFSVVWRAALLGTCGSLATHLLILGDQVFHILSPELAGFLGRYLLILSLFHLTEYLATAWTNPDNLNTDSFLLNHSAAYHLAAVASWTEFILESYFMPDLKQKVWILSIVGTAICLVGEVLRKLAMLHAGRSFSHVIDSDIDQHSKHVLVTEGVFSVFRHPSYVGWFYWSVGTQMILCNPVCLVGYTLASWAFFKDRVVFEEWTLLRAHGEKYRDYQKKVKTGLPFIEGYKIE